MQKLFNVNVDLSDVAMVDTFAQHASKVLGDRWRAALTSGESGYAYKHDPETGNGLVVVCDGRTAAGYTVTNVSAKKFAEIMKGCDGHMITHFDKFAQRVSKVLGGEPSLLQ